MSKAFGNQPSLFIEDDVVLEDDCVEMNEIIMGNGNAENNGNTFENMEIVPEVGMRFSSRDEAFEFYKKYAYNVGFPVMKRNSEKGPDGMLLYATFACSREGNRVSTTSGSLKPHPTIQTGCKTKMILCSNVLGKWHVTKVFLEHNHKTSPSKSRMYRCNRKLNDHVRRKLEINDIAGIPLHKSFNSAVVEAGGYEELPYTEKDCRNYVDKVRIRLGEGDASAIQAYFSKMQAQCHGFFFSVDLDDDSRLKNVFWADNRSRQTYREFGDVVTFDTTYLTNRYDMPFAPFVGVNHHGQSTLLGCGLLSNEDTETFVWIFKTWLQCMDSIAPSGIITDQDRAMQNAIQIVFPNTKHRWCLWHILKKFPEKFGAYPCKGTIHTAVHCAIYESQIPEEFENAWTSMIDKFALHDHDWLFGLYCERCRWVPCYLSTCFWAGMSTTQRSESINAFFDGYVHSKTSLKQFVEQYERALRCKVEKEFHADFKSYSQMVPCATKYELEKQFQSAYTISKFKEFQEELTGKVYCDLMAIEDGYPGNGSRYIVREDIILYEHMKRKDFSVVFERDTLKIGCSCHLFEFRGILCRHAISILIRNGIKMLPETYVLRRWRRDVVRAYTRVKINYDGLVSTPTQVRYEQLCKRFDSMANLVAEDEGRTTCLMEWMETQMNELRISSSSKIPGSIVNGSKGEDNGLENMSNDRILDPKCVKSKGAPRKLRKKGPLETCSRKTKGKSRYTKGNTLVQHNVEERLSITQPLHQPQLQTLNQYSYSQPILGDQLQIGTYGVNWMEPNVLNQHFIPCYVP